MRQHVEQPLATGRASLIVTYGNTQQKHWPLDRDLLVLGRAPSCDLSLVSPEVAAVHCLIHRTANGWRVRDCCGGRHATRLNGRVVRDEELHDCDTLQIGTFSFQVHLPQRRPAPAFGSSPVVNDGLAAHLRRLQRSRRNLVRLALRLRHKSRRPSGVAPSLAELERQADSLRALQRDYTRLVREYESRLGELEKAEREVCDAREELEREATERRLRLEQAERDLDRRRTELEAARPREEPAPAVAPTLRDRLGHLHRVREALAASGAGSAPGDRLRGSIESIAGEEVAPAHEVVPDVVRGPA